MGLGELMNTKLFYRIFSLLVGLGLFLFSYDVTLAVSVTFTNTMSITINHFGSASPYPAPLTISGLSGSVSDVNVTFYDFSHSWPADVEILLGSKCVVDE